MSIAQLQNKNYIKFFLFITSFSGLSKLQSYPQVILLVRTSQRGSSHTQIWNPSLCAVANYLRSL